MLLVFAIYLRSMAVWGAIFTCDLGVVCMHVVPTGRMSVAIDEMYVHKQHDGSDSTWLCASVQQSACRGGTLRVLMNTQALDTAVICVCLLLSETHKPTNSLSLVCRFSP